MEFTGSVCRCDKRIFFSRRLAKNFIRKHPEFNAKRVYQCPTSNFYHTTSKKEKLSLHPTGARFDTKRILTELKEGMTNLSGKEIAGLAIQYMEERYKKEGIYKFTTIEVAEYLDKKYPNFVKKRVSPALSKAKQETGEIVNLDETVPGAKGNVKYITTRTILEKLTEPNIKEMEATSVATVPNPSTVTVNRFDKIDTTLGEIKAQLKGLAQGYSDLSKSNGNPDEIATRVVEMLSDLTNKDSFIYSIRDEFADHVERIADTASGSEDYKKGIKDGIKLAIEMRLNGQI